MRNKATPLTDDTDLLRDQLRRGDAITDQNHINDLICRLAPRRELLRPREKDETFEIVDAAGTGRKLTAPRWLCHLLGLRHRCSHVLITTNHPKLGRLFLLQVRSWDKADSPGHLDISAAGHALAGASGDTTASEELFEELGLRPANLCEGLRVVCGYAHEECRPKDEFYNCEWRDVYLGTMLADAMGQLQTTDGEVAALMFCPETEILSLLNQPLIPLASALRVSLPLCLPAIGLVERV